MMEQVTKQIVDFVVHEKQTTSSHAMEKRGFKLCLDCALEGRIHVDTVGTDRQLGIWALVKKEYKRCGIDHQVDVWNLCKNLKTRLAAKAKKKDCNALSPWIKSITNHMWWSAMTCEGNTQLLKKKRVSILHHVANKHEWPYSTLYNRCPHGPIASEA